MSKQTWDAVPVSKVLASVERVFKTRDIENLTQTAYNTLYLMSGFIAHYNLHGFRAHYSDVCDLAHDILQSSDSRDAERYVRDPWFQNEYGIVYCQSKTDVYNGLTELASKYAEQLASARNKELHDAELRLAQRLYNEHKHELVLE